MKRKRLQGITLMTSQGAEGVEVISRESFLCFVFVAALIAMFACWRGEQFGEMYMREYGCALEHK